MKKSSSISVILHGNVIVNLPTTIVIIVVFLLTNELKLGWFFSIIFSSLAGWYVWAYFLAKWVLWAKGIGVDKERLYKLGKMGLINFTYARIAHHY